MSRVLGGGFGRGRMTGAVATMVLTAVMGVAWVPTAAHAAAPDPEGGVVEVVRRGATMIETETHPITDDVFAQDSLEVASTLEVGESATVSSADSETVVYAASSSCTTSITVYNPYRKYESSKYWATSKIKVSRSSGCAAKSYWNFLSFDSGWLEGYGWVSYNNFTVQPGYATTSWASRSCSTTSNSADWKAILTASYEGSPIDESPATSLACRK